MTGGRRDRIARKPRFRFVGQIGQRRRGVRSLLPPVRRVGGSGRFASARFTTSALGSSSWA